MVLVAIAGGTSPTLGHSLVSAILAAGKHEVIILSREPSPSSSLSTPPPSTLYGASVHYVSYASGPSSSSPSPSLLSSLRNVHTLISVLKTLDPAVTVALHRTLLNACKEVGVARFVMSDWSVARPPHGRMEAWGCREQMAALCEDENRRIHRDGGNGTENAVECSMVQVGMCMNYFAQGMPRLHTGGSEGGSGNEATDAGTEKDHELTAGLHDDMMYEYIDIARGTLVIPVLADGTPATTSTMHILDIGTFLAQALDLPLGTMRGDLGLTSQDITFAEVRMILEHKCGIIIAEKTVSRKECDEIVKDLAERVHRAEERGEFDLQAFLGGIVANMVGMMCDGHARVDASLNRLLQEHGLEVRARTVEDLLLRAWGGSG